MGKRPRIGFSVDQGQHEIIKDYAKEKGFDNPSNLARVALFNYMARNKLKRSDAVQRSGIEPE
jgi:hypothetical protein